MLKSKVKVSVDDKQIIFSSSGPLIPDLADVDVYFGANYELKKNLAFMVRR